MGLSLPISPEGLKSRYRELAKKWHPDLNPGDPQAGSKMRALGSAMEALTGIDVSQVASYAGATFAKEISRHDMDIDGVRASLTVSMVVGEVFAADWIYAASFAAGSDAVYLAGYSGKVFALTPDGRGTRVYDIGSVPTQIVDTGTSNDPSCSSNLFYRTSCCRIYVVLTYRHCGPTS